MTKGFGLYEKWFGAPEEKEKIAGKIEAGMKDASLDEETKRLSEKHGFESFGSTQSAEDTLRVFLQKEQRKGLKMSEQLKHISESFKKNSAELEDTVAQQRNIWRQFNQLAQTAANASQEGQSSLVDTARGLVERLTSLEAKKEKLANEKRIIDKKLASYHEQERTMTNRIEPSN